MAIVYEINSIDELAEHRLAWNYLLSETPQASFFHTIDWLLTYWEHFGEEQKLRVLVVMSCGKPIGIVPFCVRTEQYRVGPLRVLSYPLDNWGMWYGPLGPNPAACMMLAMQHIRNTPRDWDIIKLDWSGPSSSDIGRTTRAMRIAGLTAQKEICQTTSVIDLSGTWEQFLSSKSSKQRHEIRRKLRRSKEIEGLEYIRHRPASAQVGDGDPRWDLYEMCEQVASESWQAESSNGNTLSSDRVRDFLRDAHADAARLGMVDMNVVLVAGRPVAFGYNYHNDGRLFGLRLGFSAAYREFGVGNALILQMIQNSFRRGDESFDMGAGNSPFKCLLCTDTKSSYRLTHIPMDNLRSQAMRLSHWAKSRFSAPEAVPEKSVSA